MHPKSLLIIIPSLHRGGTETHLSQILPGLKALGWDISVFLTSGVGDLAAPLAAAGIDIHYPSGVTNKLHNHSKLLRLPLLFLTFAQLSWFLTRKRPTLVQFMLPEAYMLGGVACLLTGQKNLIMSRRSLNTYQQKYPILSKIEQWLHTKMRCIITNSQANVQQLQELEHVPAEKIHLIYNGIDTSKFTSAIHKLQTNQSLTLIVLANILPYKGHMTLLQALAQIQTQLPNNWQLLCVGQKHDYVQELIALSDNLGISQHVQWLGARQDIPQLLHQANIAISCSYEEGFSNAVIEAMASGLPMIVTNVGGNPEAVINGQTGFVVSAKDASALATAILKLANNPELRNTMGAAGRARVCENFSLDSCVMAYNKLYSSLLTL